MSEKNKYFGAWVKESQKGLKYINGKIEIDGKGYWISLFKNENKTKEKSPDYNISVKEAGK